MLPLVTVGIAAFNAEDRLERAVRSALQQDWENLEVVVVDDASQDGTVEVAERLAREDDRVRLVRHVQNQGVAAARNSVIAAATGDFIAFFDDDDSSEAGRIRAQWCRITQYEYAFAGGAPVICHSARLQVAGDGESRVEPTMGCRRNVPAPHGPAVAARILWGVRLDDGYGAVATCSQMARAAVYRQIGGFDPCFRRSEDTEFCVRLALEGGHFIGIDVPLVRQALTPRRDKTFENELRYKLALIDKYRQTAPTPGHFALAGGFMRFKAALQRRDRLSAVSELSRLMLTHPILTMDRFSQTVRHGASKPILSHFAH